MTAPTPDAAPRRAGRRRWLWLGLQLAGTAAAFTYIGSLIELESLTAAFARVSPWAVLAAAALTFTNLVAGATRWRVLLRAYGAPRPPSILQLTHVYWIGFFYNNCLPGGVGGDVVRGMVTRRAFEGSGATASMTVVLVERMLGLSGLLLLVSVTSLVRPLAGTEAVLPYSALGLLAATAGVAAVAVGRRVADRVPGRVGALLGSLPEIQRPLYFAAALAMSLVTQAFVALTGWVLLDAISGGEVSVQGAMVVVPLAMATAFFPLTVGGAGAREGAFVFLCGAAFGMASEDGLAVSLLLWASQLAVAAAGGLAQLVSPVPTHEEPARGPDADAGSAEGAGADVAAPGADPSEAS